MKYTIPRVGTLKLFSAVMTYFIQLSQMYQLDTTKKALGIVFPSGQGLYFSTETKQDYRTSMKNCIKCHKEMRMFFQYQHTVPIVNVYTSFELHACTNPACPNYALLAIPEEDMPKDQVLDTKQK